MSFVYWVPNADGDWSTLSNWSGGVLPTSTDVVTISTSTIHTVTHSQGNDFIQRLSVGNDIFNMTGGALTIAQQAALSSSFSMSGGALTIGGTFSIGANFSLSGGTLTVNAPITVAGNFSQSGGALDGAGAVTVTGTAQLQGGSLGQASTLQVGGTVVMANYQIAGTAQLINSSTLNETGNVTLGDATGIGAGIVNQAGAVYNIGNAVTVYSGAATASISNAGLLADLAGTGTSAINVSTTSTGTVSVAAGSTLVFQGALTTLGGTVTGAGTLAFAGGGTATITAGTTIGVNALSVYGLHTTLSVGGNLSLAGGYSESDGSLLLLNGHTMTVSGNAQFNQSNGSPDITGSGTLVTQATTTLGGNTPLVIGGSVLWSNSGTVIDNGTLQIGDSNTAAARVTNAAAGVFNITVNGGRIANGSTPVSTFSSAGTLEMTANGGTAFVDVNATSTGLVSVAASDILVFDGQSTTLSGTLSGAGQISFAGGSSTVAAGSTVSVAAIALYNNGTTLTLGNGLTLAGTFSMGNASTLALAGNIAITGSFSQGSGSTVSLGGHTLVLNGGGGFTYIGGTGLVQTRGTIGLGGGNTIGGAVAWRNYGTALQTGNIQIGDNSSTAASLTNEAGAIYNVAGSNLHLYNGSTPVSTLANAGLLEMTANGGTSYTNLNVTSTGTVSVALGDAFEFDGAANAFSGKLLGAGQITLANGGSSTFAAGTTVSVATLATYTNGTTVTLGGSLTVSGALAVHDGTTIALGANTLTLAGPASFQQGNGSPVVTGTGTLATHGVTTLVNGGTPLVIGGGATWTNTGTVLDSGSLEVGNSPTIAAAVVNAAGGVFNILSGNLGLYNGSTPTSAFTNAGTLEMTAQGGGTGISVNLASTGTVLVAAGDNLEIDGASNSLAGTIGGAGQFSFGNNASTIAAGTAISVGTLAIYRANGNVNTTVTTLGTLAVTGGLAISSTTTLTLGGNMSVAGAYSQRDSSTVAIGANTLTLTGAAQFQQYNGAPLVTGSGTLATSGTVTLVNGGTALTIGGTATWSNTGTVLDSGSLQIGNTAGSAARLVNAASGVISLLSNNISIYSGSTPVSTFTNAGTLAMAANGGTSSVSADLTSTGLLTSATGDNLELDGPVNSIAGTLSGAGQISFGAGSTTLAGGTAISVGTLAVYGSANATQVALAGNVTVSGNFFERDGSVIALAGHTLTLSGAAQFQYYYGPPQVTGPGTLATRGTTTLVGGNTALTIGGSAVWSNSGTVLDNGNVQVGNTNTVAAGLVNAAGGVFDIVAGNVSVLNGSNPASSFSNAGLLEMTAAGASSGVNLAVANTGTILAQGGTLGLGGAVSGTGLIEVSGGGSVAFSTTVASTQTFKFLDAASFASITLPSATAFGATIGGFVQGDTIDLTNISNATATFNAGVLTFTDNNSHATVAVLHFSNTPNFTFASDGRGGTLIGDPALTGAAAAIANRAYFTNTGSGTETVALAAGTRTLIGGFSYSQPDVLDLRQLLAGTQADQDLANIGQYLSTRAAAGGTALMFDPNGGGHAGMVGLMTNVSTTLADLSAHHALLLK